MESSRDLGAPVTFIEKRPGASDVSSPSLTLNSSCDNLPTASGKAAK